jgi:hypothetical protein
MSEKQVSVRLVARGGQQVRAELEQIGTTGAAALGRIEPAAESAARAMARVGDVSRVAGMRMRGLAFQLNDVFVSLAGGMNPMMVFIQQGSQIAQIYAGQGGVTSALRDVGTMARWVVTRLGPVGAVVGAAAAAVAGMRGEIERTSGVAVTFGDTALAVWQVVRDGAWNLIRPAALKIGEWFAIGWRAVVDATRIAGNALVRGVRIAVAAIGAAWNGGWRSLYGTALIAVDDTILAVATFGDRAAAIFTGAYDAVLAIWQRLPQALGDFAFSAANTLIAGVEAMLNGVVERINSFIRMLNTVLSKLPEWATGEGGLQIGTIGDVALGRVPNPYAGQASAAGAAAQGAFDAALARTYINPPETGLRARGAEALSAGAAAWAEFQAQVREIMASDPLGEFFDEVKMRAIENALARAAEAAKKAGGALARMPEEAMKGLDLIIGKLDDYARQARDMAGSIGDALIGAFRGAEDAIAEFVRTGKLEFGSLVTSILADMARIAARRFILGPLAQGLGKLLGGGVGAALATVLHSGGVVGMAGVPRAVPALAFAGASRLHAGGWAGLRPDEVPAILQRGERVLSRREARAWSNGGGVTVNIMTRDAESFRASRTQIAADIARAVAAGRRGM